MTKTDGDLSPETRTLLSRGREGHRMSESHRRGLKRAVLAQVAAGGVLATTTTAAAWTSLGAKLVGLAVVVAVVGGGVRELVRPRGAAPIATEAAMGRGVSRSEPPRTQASSVAAATSVQVSAPRAPVSSRVAVPPVSPLATELPQRERSTHDSFGTSLPSAVELGAPPSAALPPIAPSANVLPGVSVTYSPLTAAPGEPAPTVAPSPASVSASAPPPSLEADARLVRDADRALRAGDAVTSLRLLDEHARRFPESALEPERSAERVLALCQTGRVADARRGAQVFLAAHPDGPLAARVLGSCGAKTD